MAARESRTPPGDAAPAAPGWGWPDALVALGVALNLAVYAALGGMPWQDAANHAARYALIARAWFGVPAPWVRVVPLPAPYLGLDAVAAALAAVVGPAWAAHLVGAAALSAPAAGLLLLLRRTAPPLRAGALAGVLLGFSFYFLNGLLNYVLGIGAALAWVAAWWPRRAQCSAGARAALALGAGALYSLHLTAVCAALAVAGAELLAAAAADARAARTAGRRLALGALLRAHAGRLATLAAAAGAVGALWLALALALPPAPGVSADSAPIFRPWPSKAWTLTMPFYTFGPWEMAATLPAYAAGLAGVLRAGWRGRAPNAPQGDAAAGTVWRSPAALAVLGFAALYLATPMATTAGYSLLDVRWLLPSALLAFAAVPATAGGATPARRGRRARDRARPRRLRRGARRAAPGGATHGGGRGPAALGARGPAAAPRAAADGAHGRARGRALRVRVPPGRAAAGRVLPLRALPRAGPGLVPRRAVGGGRAAGDPVGARGAGVRRGGAGGGVAGRAGGGAGGGRVPRSAARERVGVDGAAVRAGRGRLARGGRGGRREHSSFTVRSAPAVSAPYVPASVLACPLCVPPVVPSRPVTAPASWLCPSCWRRSRPTSRSILPVGRAWRRGRRNSRG